MKILFVLASLITSISPALATDTGSDEVLDDVRVILPYGSAESHSTAIPVEATVPDADRAAISVDISSWAPSNLTLDSHLSDSTAFQSAGLPYVSASLTGAPLLHGRAGTLTLRGGLGLEHLTRSGTVDIPGSAQTYSQDAYLIPVEFSLEARPTFLQWRKLGFYFDAGVLPTLMLTERSPFDDGRTIIGLPARFLVGGSYDVRGILPVKLPAFFDLGVSSTVGSVSEGSMNGTGILAGVRVAI